MVMKKTSLFYDKNWPSCFNFLNLAWFPSTSTWASKGLSTFRINDRIHPKLIMGVPKKASVLLENGKYCWATHRWWWSKKQAYFFGKPWKLKKYARDRLLNYVCFRNRNLGQSLLSFDFIHLWAIYKKKKDHLDKIIVTEKPIIQGSIPGTTFHHNW